ncbi:UNVERIFIED_CONTAM: hypothetical protein PYX00_006325 [Menopon gallinae]|uniref:Chaoptin n=1 Tax=Menopon gallinae TaxID=328185 RepID=A0AAW2HUZ2_9NEOP
MRNLGTKIDYPVGEMILESNNLPSLPGRVFEGLEIKRLMLRDNGLERVTSNWLATLTLPSDALDHLRKVEAVTLQGGYMKRAPKFSSLHNLRYIQIHSPVLMDLTPDNFHHLPSLEQLHLIGSPLLSKLDARLFTNLHKLSLLNISNCGLSWIHPKAMQNLPNLSELSLIGNRIPDASIVGRACRDLHNLHILRLDNNFIDRIMEGSFSDLPALRELYISGNMISEIHKGAFRNTPSLKILDLSRNIIRRINAGSFTYPSGNALEELWITDNQLYHVNEMKALFGNLPRLRFLDLSRNYFEEIPFDALRGHATLERLHLDENRIKRIPRKAFSGMTTLRELRLRNNSIFDIPEGPAWNLPSLKGLDLSRNKIRRLDSRLLTYLPSLRRLDISENDIDNVLPDAFIGNLQLETLNISKNFISSFHALTFGHLPKLFEVDAGWNRLREVIPGLPKNIEHLRLNQNQIYTLPNDLDLPALRLLDLSGNSIQVIPQHSFRSMSRLQWLYLNDNLLENVATGALNGLSRLETLNLKNNRIRHVHENWLKELVGLSQINLQGNQLEILPSGLLKYSPKLKSLNLGNNNLTDILPGSFSNLRELQELNLSHNSLVRMPEALQSLHVLQFLDLTQNRIRSIQPFSFERLPSLTELRMGNNRISSLPSNTFKDLPKLEFLDLNNNELEDISRGAFQALPSLVAVRLSKNRLRTLSEESFNDLPELQSAELQSNHITEIPDNAFVNVPHLALLNLSSNLILQLEKSGIMDLKSLEVLDLSNNRVSWLEGRNFQGMDWLVELKMDNNQICNIHGSPFNNLSRLRVLSLKHNRMTSVSEAAFQKLKNNIMVLDIDGNPLSCSCKMLWLQSWIEETTTEGPRCADGTLFREKRLSRTECGSSRIVEPVVPGCETETFQDSPLESAPLSALNLGLKNNTVGLLPHESEYFYDEYVEYQYEEVNTTESSTSGPILTTESTIRVANITQHNGIGETPTIYARPAYNITKPGLGLDDLKKAQQQQQQNYNGLTFFGIPLPSLSLGSIWKGNAGRSADKGHTRNRYAVGKVQPVIKTTSQGHPNFVTPTTVDSSGFHPIIPTTQAFVPAYNVSELEDKRHVHSDESFPSSEVTTEKLPTENPENTFIKQEISTEGVLPSTFYIHPDATSLQESVLVDDSSARVPASTASYPPWSETFTEESSIYRFPEIETPKWSNPNFERARAPFHEDSTSTSTEANTHKVNNWYFQNYNKTNLEPFIGVNSGSFLITSYYLLLSSLLLLLKV